MSVTNSKMNYKHYTQSYTYFNLHPSTIFMATSVVIIAEPIVVTPIKLPMQISHVCDVWCLIWKVLAPVMVNVLLISTETFLK